MDLEKLRADLKRNGQDHLLQFWEELTDDEQQQLYKDITGTNVGDTVASFHRSMAMNVEVGEELDGRMAPLGDDVFSSRLTPDAGPRIQIYRRRGLLEIGESRVGVLLLAGGQGTRLGVSYPKGMYDVGLPSKKSLYQIQAERIQTLMRLAGKRSGNTPSIPWYIMTSAKTRKTTTDFLEANNFFGLPKDDVIVFEQGMVPSFTFDGRIILEGKAKLAKSPDGNGGLYRALREQLILEDMKKRNLSCVHVYCVDNILVKVADPVFVGYCLSEGADCGAKVVPKAYPDEPVGVICAVDDRFQVAEYSEISKATAHKTDGQGKLMFNAGNICNHFFTLDFLSNVANKQESEMPFHIARKKIPYVDSRSGELVKPMEPNGVKLEKFVFDVFSFSEKFRVWEVSREEEFSPVKNAEGATKDTPTTARRMIYDLHKQYLQKAGATIAGESSDAEKVVVEISPLVSYEGEGLEHVRGKVFTPPVHIQEE
ncbi:unnamed protein product [Cyprideis torosa]|uniref:UDP-N-acetylglucosamine diphosphorylase n=1 Tax=Cyprideis torosa TaxID=163714 RepID=A0A7R8W4K7_9CRUS|nr:unnamed protein product [Cyprideis torosa]CAG0881987.1 unnamed protein product [Cyprideis torosa]